MSNPTPKKTQFPKLLVVTSFAPNPVGGALVRQLLRGYPASRLHWWTCAAEKAVGPDLETEEIHYHPIPRRLYPHRRFSRVKSLILERFWLPGAAASLRRRVREIQPDVVWCQLTGFAVPAFRQAGVIGSTRTHVSIWDYHETRSHRMQYGAARAKCFTQLSEEAFRTATTCDVVSAPMLDDLRSRTGRSDAFIVHSGFEPAQFKRLAEGQPRASAQIRIAYTGSIIAPESFQLFIRALDSIRGSLSRPVTLELFSRDFRSEPWFDPEWMNSHGLLDEKVFQQKLDECSWGFSPMHLTDDDAAYNRYSFPNKFGTYLACGLPLIVLAHRESSAARMIQLQPAGVWSDATDVGDVAAILRQALELDNPKLHFRPAILRWAADEFDADRMRSRLWEALGVR